MNFDILCRYPISVGSYIRFADIWVDEQMNSRKMCIRLAVTLIKRIGRIGTVSISISTASERCFITVNQRPFQVLCKR